MQIYIPDIETVEELHEVVLIASGGKPGMHDKKLIIKAIERPSTFVHYVDDYDLDTICALLVDGIARYHGFKDGNKRTALITIVFTYRLNGVHLKATEAMNLDFDNFVVWIVQEKPTIDDIKEKLSVLRSLHEGDKENWLTIIKGFITQASKHNQ